MLQIPVLSTLLAVWSVENIVKVTGKKSGKAVKKTLKATITVKNPALSVKAADIVAVGATEQITATVKPANTKITYTSDNTDVATVDEKGLVTGVKAGDVIEVKEKYKSAQRYKDVLEVTGGRMVPAWLDVDQENLRGTVKEMPTRDEIDVPVNEMLIVELYSK